MFSMQAQKMPRLPIFQANSQALLPFPTNLLNLVLHRDDSEAAIHGVAATRGQYGLHNGGNCSSSSRSRTSLSSPLQPACARGNWSTKSKQYNASTASTKA